MRVGKTISDKIIEAHLIKGEVYPGSIVEVSIDIALGNDITMPIAIDRFLEAGGREVFDRERVVIVPDHFTPNKDIDSAIQCQKVRDFARKFGIKNYFEVGRGGIEHVLLPEKGLVLPGDLVIGADSHTCTYGALGAFSTGVGSTDLAYGMLTGTTWLRVPETIKFVYYGSLKEWVSGKDLILYTIGMIGTDGATYKVMEFAGEVVSQLSMDDRFTMANMAIEAGAKAGLFEPDEKTLSYVVRRAKRPYTIYSSDEDAEYEKVYEIDVSSLDPQVACPHSPGNVKGVWELTDVKVDQVVIGSCTNGRITDMRVAAELLRGRKVHPDVRLIVIPGSQEVYMECLREGILEVFIEAGAAVSTPTCGPCLGGHMGILGKGEVALSTTNRNFIGRMGHPESEVYLASPAVAAATAVLGRIAYPEEVLDR